MSLEDDFCPFQPGAGQRPPLMGGRKREQESLRLAASRLLRKDAPRGASAPVLVTGPRGNGKTCLLLWFEDALQEAWRKAGMGKDLQVVRLSARRLSGHRALDALAPDGWGRLLRKGAESIRKAHPRANPMPPSDLTPHDVLQAQCRAGNAYALLIDEAHTLDLDMGCALFNAWQELAPSHRIMLVLAGTPDLADHVNDMNATFASRSKKLLVGRLPPAGAREALIPPLEDAEVRLSEEQEREALAECQEYPFFIQIWGEQLWLSARRGGTAALSKDQFREAMREAATTRASYYDERRTELKKLGLSAVAGAVAALYRKPDDRVSESGLESAVWGALGGEATDGEVQHTLTQLKHCGLVWPSPQVRDDDEQRGRGWEAGIPSLMANIRRNTPGPAKQHAASVSNGLSGTKET